MRAARVACAPAAESDECVRRYGHAAHRHAAEYHAAAAHHNMAAAAGYGGLLLGRGGLHPQYKPVDWPAQHHAPHHLDPAACSPYSYPAVPGTYLLTSNIAFTLYLDLFLRFCHN